MVEAVDLARHTTEPATEKLVIYAQFRGHAGHGWHYTLHASLLGSHCEDLRYAAMGAVNTRAKWETAYLSLVPNPTPASRYSPSMGRRLFQARHARIKLCGL